MISNNDTKLIQVAKSVKASLLYVGRGSLARYIFFFEKLGADDLEHLQKEFRRQFRWSLLFKQPLPPFLIMEREFIMGSSDVYPIEFSEYKEFSSVLVGENPFLNLAVAFTHLRLQIESELRGLILRFKAISVMSRNSCHQKECAPLLSSLSTLIRAILRVRGESSSGSFEENIQRFEKLSSISLPHLKAGEVVLSELKLILLYVDQMKV